MSSCASIFTPAKQTITFSGMEGTKIYDNGRKIATIDESGEATARIRKKLSSKELIAKKEGYKSTPFLLEARFNPISCINLLNVIAWGIAEVTSKQHAHVMRDIRSLLSQGVSASNFGLGSYTDANGQKRPLFNLTPKGCLILASGYDAVLRERIINRLEYLENEKKVIKTPQTYLEALEALVASEKEKEQLRIETERQQKQIEQKDAKITKLQPKADFAQAAFKAEGKVDIGQAAKILNLGFGRNTLFGKLRDAGIFFKDRNEPKQKYIDAGYFEMTLLPPIRRDNHPDILCQKVFCKPKGLAYINHLFGGKPSDGKIAKIK